MKKAMMAAAAALALCGQASAMNVGTPQTYSRLVWTAAFSGGAFAGCNQVIFDATGDLVNSNSLSIYGTLNCGTIGYGMTGSLYVAVDGTMNITMLVGGQIISCPRVASWVGNCTVFDANNVARAAAVISLIP